MTYAGSSGKERILWVDMAKGLAIILVIAGHTIPGIIWGIIFSFHMPLFFFLSGYTSKCSETKEQLSAKLKRTAKGLLVPAFTVHLVFMICMYATKQVSIPSVWHAILSIISTCTVYPHNIIYVNVSYLWFLVALFIVRNFYDSLNYITGSKCMTFLSVAFSIFGTCIGKEINLPFSFDIACAALIFYHAGSIMRQKNIVPTFKMFIVSIIFWTVSFAIIYLPTHMSLDFLQRLYPMAPLCFFTAFAGIMSIVYICMRICGNLYGGG